MIIVSGPDNSGKSTLVRHLTKELGLGTVSKDYPTPPWKHAEEYTKWIQDILDDMNTFDIVDRCFIDEMVYGPIMRGGICFNKYQYSKCIQAILKATPLFIITDPGDEKIKETFMDRKQYPNLAQNISVAKEFRTILRERPFNDCPSYHFDYRFDPNYHLVTHVARHYIIQKGMNK